MKIPKEAKRVFKGEIFDVYHWDQEVYDGTTKVFEALKRKATVQVVPIIDEKFVLIREQQPASEERFTFVGGRLEEGEEPKDCAGRELLEETGMESDNIELVKVYRPIGKIDWPIYLFVARDCRKVAEQNLDWGEKIKLLEFGIDEFVEKVASRDFWATMISDDIFRMIHEGRLDDFKKLLLGK